MKLRIGLSGPFTSGVAFLFSAVLSGCLLSDQVLEINRQSQQVVTSTTNDGGDHNTDDNSPPSSLPANSNSQISFATVNKQTMNLGEIRSIPVMISSSNYTGDVSLAVNRVDLDSVDQGKDISISVNPAIVSLTPGKSVQVNVEVDVDTLSPDFNSGSAGERFHLVGQMEGGSRSSIAQEVKLAVLPVIEINLLDKVTMALQDRVLNPGNVLLARSHQGGVTVRWVNKDPNATAIIHGQNPIPHQNTSQPLMRAPAAGQSGGIYQQTITSTQVNQIGSFWRHDGESSGRARRIQFNTVVNNVVGRN